MRRNFLHCTHLKILMQWFRVRRTTSIIIIIFTIIIAMLHYLSLSRIFSCPSSNFYYYIVMMQVFIITSSSWCTTTSSSYKSATLFCKTSNISNIYLVYITNEFSFKNCLNVYWCWAHESTFFISVNVFICMSECILEHIIKYMSGQEGEV